MPTRLPTRRELLRASAAVLVLGPISAACGPVNQSTPTTAANPLIKPTAARGADLTPVLATSEVARGRNRFAIGLIDARNQPITTGSVRVEFFKVDQQAGTGQKRSEGTATFRAVELLNKGLWVMPATFDEVGTWGAQVTLERPGESPRSARLGFEVKPSFSAPGYDAAAPKSRTLTLQDVGGDATRLCSNNPPCDLHEVSLDQALSGGKKPVVLLFATPALCTSATCAPELTAVSALRDRYRERATFVHVEIYKYPYEEQKPVAAVEEWKIPSEPWVFISDRQGIVRDRFEGAAPVEELEPSLAALL